MSKLSAIVLSLFIFVQSLGLHPDDLMQINELLTHARFHNQQYGDNLITFISKHYGELKAQHEMDHQEEKDDHEKLPFQHPCNNILVLNLIFTPYNPGISFCITQEKKKTNYNYIARNSKGHYKKLFQPPIRANA
ncbi:hypothetical protein [Zeaxanthinibacter enoshimensis]|uniref:hypothetical protein n=1 Tax=Zeaxanthinibacter enoshimensis TaxID=392009 RepID=UPI0035695D08